MGWQLLSEKEILSILTTKTTCSLPLFLSSENLKWPQNQNVNYVIIYWVKNRGLLRCPSQSSSMHLHRCYIQWVIDQYFTQDWALCLHYCDSFLSGFDMLCKIYEMDTSAVLHCCDPVLPTKQLVPCTKTNGESWNVSVMVQSVLISLQFGIFSRLNFGENQQRDQEYSLEAWALLFSDKGGWCGGEGTVLEW